jgi:hypothetical protein
MGGGAGCDARGVGTLFRRVCPRSTKRALGLAGESGSCGFLPESLPERTPAAAIFLGLWMIGRQETTSARADEPYINTPHQRNASQISRTESACTSIAAIQITFI